MISEKCDSIAATQLNNNSRSDTNNSSSKWYEDDLIDSNINTTDNQQQNYNSASNNNSIVEASLPILSQSATGIPIPTTIDKVFKIYNVFNEHTLSHLKLFSVTELSIK